ncbi:hypothetical protein D3C87_1271610 [compost metagenome]
MAQFSLDQFVDVLVGGVVQGFVLAGGGEECLDLFPGVRVQAGDVVGFVYLGAVEMFVVFGFVSGHGAAPCDFACFG